MSEGISSRLRPDSEAMGLGLNWNAFHISARRVDDVDRIVVATGEPELFAVDADVAHVRTATARDGPSGLDFTRGKVNDADTAFAFRRAVDSGDAAVGNIQLGAVAARV